MQKLSLLLLTAAITLCSCGQSSNKIEASQAIFFYNTINDNVDASVDVEQKFIDTATQIVLTLKSNKFALIDTKSFQQLLDSARAINLLTEKNIENIQEIDTKINYKQKVLDWLNLFDSLYNNEFAKFAMLLDQKEEDRFTKGAALIMPRLKMIKEKELIVKDARQTFENKYPTDENGNVRSKPDYEYVKLTDFKYEQANIKEDEEIILLSFSGGGKNCTDETIYYRQFIGIVKSTGDTIRVLSACQDYELDKANRIGYFYSENAIPANNIEHISADNSFIVFNKHQTNLEKNNYRTIIGSLGFKE